MSQRKRKVTIDGKTYLFNGWWWIELATGDPVRDSVLLELRKHEPDFSTPRDYVNRHLGNPHRQICWRCKNQVNSTIHKTCPICEWVKCPHCGACGCQHWKYRRHYQQEPRGSRASSKRKYAKSGQNSPSRKNKKKWWKEPSSRKKKKVKRARRSPLRNKRSARRQRDVSKGLPQPGFTSHLRRGINRLLHDLYGTEMLVSTILRQGKTPLSERDVKELEKEHLQCYLLRLVRAWRTQWDSFLGRRDIHVLFRAYALDGEPPSSHASLDDILSRLRAGFRRRRLERIARVIANDVLGK